MSYPRGTVAEHLACRADAVAFDVSHLGTVRVEGPGALDRLQGALTNDLAKIGPGRAQYTHLLDPADGSVLDDIIVWWVDERRFDVMPNASNTAAGPRRPGRCREHGDRRHRRAGDHRRPGPPGPPVLADGVPRQRPRSGASGSAGFAGTAPRSSWPAPATPARTASSARCPPPRPTSSGRPSLATGVTPAGLGARDTLRLEAALPLHGHELGPGITPLQAGLGWVVAWDKPGGFRGLEALQRERADGVRPPPGRPGHCGTPTASRPATRCSCDGRPVGEVTSGNFSPVLGHGIALALMPPTTEPGTARGDRRPGPAHGRDGRRPAVRRQTKG